MIRPLLTWIKSISQRTVGFLSINAVKYLIRLIKSNNIVVTNLDGYTDGAGAQTQRVLSIYALAGWLGLPFDFKPITKIEFQPVDFVYSTTELENHLFRLNSWLSQLSNNPASDLNDFREIKLNNPREFTRELVKALCYSRFRGKGTRIHLLDGYLACKTEPKIWNVNFPLKMEPAKYDIFTISLHLRMSNFSPTSDRSVDMSYFTTLCDYIQRLLMEMEIPHIFVIHTDFTGSPIDADLLNKHSVPQSLVYWQQIGMLNARNEIKSEFLDSINSELRQIQNNLKYSIVYQTKHWISEWSMMSHADILIVGKSSYSAVGGLLNKSGLVICPSYWNANSSNWIVSRKIDKVKKRIYENLILNF